MCEILGVDAAVVASEGSLPKSPLHDGNDMGMVTCESCGKQIREEDRADGCEDLDVIICKECSKEMSKMVEGVQKSVKREMSSPYAALGGPVGVIVFVLMIFIGIPLFKTCTSELRYKVRRSRERPMNTSVEPSSLNGESSNTQGNGVLAERQEKSSVGSLPEDGIYSAPQGTGGSYKDPINGYFEVQPPAGFRIRERRDKSKFTITSGSPHVGEVVPQSFIQFIFPKEKAFIAVITRKTFVTIEQDFEFLLKGFPRRFPGIKINRSRFVTIDGVKGIEVFASWRGQKLFIVKYKKHGLDHSITINCDIADFPKFQDEFLAFLRSYHSIGHQGRN